MYFCLKMLDRKYVAMPETINHMVWQYTCTDHAVVSNLAIAYAQYIDQCCCPSLASLLWVTIAFWILRFLKCKNIRDELFGEMTPESQQLIKGAMEKRASSWLSALPVKASGYALNKQEFTDAVCMRYEWKSYPITVPVDRQTLWITASYVN